MKRIYTLFVVLAGVGVWFAACSKKYNNPNSVEPNVVNPFGGPPDVSAASLLNKLRNDLRSTPEKQCVTAGIEQTIVFSKGTILKFHPNSFKDKAGNIITSGTVCIEMIEMYKPGDMIANWASTNTVDGEILSSGGQVNIKATKNGEEVYANEYGISFLQPMSSPAPMYLYYGNNSNEDSIVTWEQFDDRVPSSLQTYSDSSGTLPRTYNIFNSCTKFAWLNCDQPDYIKVNPSIPRTRVKIDIDTQFYRRSDYMDFLILHELNAVVRVGKWVPVGLDASVVCIICKNGSYYYFEKKGITITEGMTIKVSPNIKSLDYIKESLAAL